MALFLVYDRPNSDDRCPQKTQRQKMLQKEYDYTKTEAGAGVM